MHAVVGRVKIKPGHEDETLAMIGEHGVAMLHGMSGSAGGYWARTLVEGDLIQHSFWLFDTEENARSAEATFNTLRDMPDAPASFLSVDVCEVVEKVDDPDSGSTSDLPAARFRQIRNTTIAFPSVVDPAVEPPSAPPVPPAK